MLKKIIGVSIALAMVLPLAASAATFSNVAFDNGDVTISGVGASTVNATLHIVVPANQVVERIETDVTGDNLAPVCTAVGGSTGLQEGTYDVTLPIKLPPNTGTYSLSVKGSGIYGGFSTPDCTNDVVGTATFSNSLRVTSGSTSGSNFAGTGMSLADLIAALKAAGVSVGSPAPVPATSTACAALSAKLVGTVDNTYNDQNVKLQGFLLSEGMSIPALKAGASFGYKGSQTNGAVSMFRAVNNCI